MMIFEVLNYFDRSRYFVSAHSVDEMLAMVDQSFVEKLARSLQEGEYYDEKNQAHQYDALRQNKEERMKDIYYTLLIEDATHPTMAQRNLEEGVEKFYF